MLPLQFISKFIKILRSAASPSQIAGGFIIGMTIGLLPSFFNPVSLLLVLLLILINVNIATAIFAYAIFSGIAYLADPLFHSFGYTVLVDISALVGIWKTLYDTPFVPFTGFNNTLVMGSLVTALVLMIPVFIVVKKGITFYRVKYEPKVQNIKAVKLIKATSLYKWYEKLKFLGD